MKSRRKSDFLSSRVQYISLAQLSPNPQQPRRSFDEAALRELADSIRAYGILQPLTVRRTPVGYQLVAASAVCGPPGWPVCGRCRALWRRWTSRTRECWR